MTDDPSTSSGQALITRLRALMAEIEHKLADDDGISPKLREAVTQARQEARDALSSLPSAYPSPHPSPKAEPSQDLRASDLCTTPAKTPSTGSGQAHKPRDSYIARDPLHDDGFDPEDFIGCGDRDPLGHDAMARGRER